MLGKQELSNAIRLDELEILMGNFVKETQPGLDPIAEQNDSPNPPDEKKKIKKNPVADLIATNKNVV